MNKDNSIITHTLKRLKELEQDIKHQIRYGGEEEGYEHLKNSQAELEKIIGEVESLQTSQES